MAAPPDQAGHAPADDGDGAALTVPHALTDLTPRWMTAALSSRLPGVIVASVEVEPARAGTNAHARVALTYRRGSGPASVFVKGPGSLHNRLSLAALGALATEARLAAAGVELPLPHPRPYAGAVDRRRLAAAVVMDDVVASGATPNDGVRPLSVAQVRSGLGALAHLHAAFAGARRPPALAFLRPWRLSRGWALVSAANLGRGVRRHRRLTGRSPMPAGLTVPDLARQFRRWATVAGTGAQTLLHGDPHPANTYALAGDQIGFCDWQLARTGHWSHDVGYFVTGSLHPGERRAHERSLLDGYLGSLRAGGGAAEAPDAAWERYRASQAYGLAAWLHTLAFATFQPDALSLAMVARYAAAYGDLDTAASPCWA